MRAQNFVGGSEWSRMGPDIGFGKFQVQRLKRGIVPVGGHICATSMTGMTKG
jgi:hypothetical protein